MSQTQQEQSVSSSALRLHPTLSPALTCVYCTAYHRLLVRHGARLPAIKYGGPLWCLAFLIPWWPWSSEPGSLLVGAHFCVSICMFDSFLTYVRTNLSICPWRGM